MCWSNGECETLALHLDYVLEAGMQGLAIFGRAAVTEAYSTIR